MPWQQMVLDVGLELDPTSGLPAYREIICTLMRQNGKSSLTAGVMAHRATLWQPQPQRVAYSAQDGSAARKKLIEDVAAGWQRSPVVGRLIDKVLRGVGYEGVIFATGSRIDVIGSSESAGHGRTLDLAIIDESFADSDFRRESAISPAMATRRDAQVWNVSTAGTDASVFLRRKIDAGRSAVAANTGGGVAFFEWSVGTDEDVDDPATWWRNMPALGWTIGEDTVRHARASMSDGEFRRGFCNQWTVASERVIPAAVWDVANRVDVAPGGNMFFALDVNPERTAACLAVVGDGAPITAEVIEHRPSVGWVVERTAEVLARWPGCSVVVDARGPAGSLVPDLKRVGVRVVELPPTEVQHACAAFFDDLANGRLCIRRNAALDVATLAVTRQTIGDAWRWARRDSSDITPLMAVTLATWAATRRQNSAAVPRIVDPWSSDYA